MGLSLRRCFGIAILAVLIFPSAGWTAEHGPWELRKDADGIRVFTRRVEGFPILEYKGVVTVNIPVRDVVRFGEAVERFPEWFYEAKQARVLEKIEGGQIIYFVMGMPWPVKDRDCVYRRLISMDADGTVAFRQSAAEDIFPAQKGLVRVPFLKTTWRYRPLDPNRTEVTFQQLSHPGGLLPAALVNRLVVTIPFESLKKFREILERENRGRPAEIL